jgi:hypothetical protein
MATNLTTTLFESLMKVYYPKPGDVESATLEKRKLLQKLMGNADRQFGGEGKKIPWKVDDPTGGNTTYATALSDYTSSTNKHILVDAVNEYQPFGVTTRAVKASRNDMGALLRALKSESDRAANRMGNAISYRFFRDSSGAIGQILTGSAINTTTLFFSNRGDVHDVNVGQKLVFGATKTGALRSATALTVTAVQRGAGTVTLSAAPSSLGASIAAGDYIFISGRAQNGASEAPAALGIGDYVPATAPTVGDSFTGSGLNRSTDERMSGVRVDGSSLSIEAGLIELIAEIQFNNGMQDGDDSIIVMNPLQGAKFANALGSKIFYDEVAGSAKGIGTGRTMARLGTATCEIFMDENHCPVGYAFGLTPSTWEPLCYDELVGLIDTDGLQVRQSLTFDGVVGIYAAYYNFGCYAPWSNGRLTLPNL